MNDVDHLQALQVEEAAEGQTTAEVRVHLAGCSVCRARVTRAVKLERALYAIPRVEPAPGLASHVRAAVAASAAKRRLRPHSYGIGLAAALAGLLALVLVYQAGVELEVGGALNFFSFYVHQPEVVINYPGDALAALVEVLPLAQMLTTLAAVVIAAILAWRFHAAVSTPTVRGWSRRA